MSQSQVYELERDSRLMCYLPGGESIGGMLGHPIELELDQIDDDYFAQIKALIAQVLDVKNTYDENGIKGISGDFSAAVEIGPKGTPAHKLTRIFESVPHQVVPAEILKLRELLQKAIRVSEGRDPEPPRRQMTLDEISVADLS